MCNVTVLCACDRVHVHVHVKVKVKVKVKSGLKAGEAAASSASGENQFLTSLHFPNFTSPSTTTCSHDVAALEYCSPRGYYGDEYRGVKDVLLGLLPCRQLNNAPLNISMLRRRAVALHEHRPNRC